MIRGFMGRARLFMHGVLCGAFGGVFAGVADAWGTHHRFLGRSFLGIAVLDWTIVVLALGAAGGNCAAIALRRDDARGPRSSPALAALLLALCVILPAALLVLVSLNVSVLGGDTEPLTLLADAAVFAAAAALVIFAVRALAPAIEHPGSRLGRLAVSPAFLLGTPAVVFALAALSWRGGAAAVGPPSVPAPAGAPNVVLVLIDTLEAGRLSGGGNPHGTSPWLDRLARRGVHFASCTSQSCYTKPSVASLLTSLVPSAHRVGHLRTVLSPSLVTLPEAFHDAGWRTSMIVSNTILGAEFGFAQGAELFLTLPTEELGRTKLGYALRRLGEERRIPPFDAAWSGLRRLESWVTGTPDSRTLHLDAAAVEAAFRERQAAIGDAPSFTYLHYMEPHAPYRPPRPDGLRFLAPGDSLREQHPSTVGLFLPFSRAESVSEPHHRGLVAAYEGEIAALDRKVGRLLEECLASDRPTVVAVTADHGEEFGEHGGWGHGQSLYEEQLRIPWILAGAGVPRHVVAGAPARLIDVAPTLLALAGSAPPAAMSGASRGSDFERVQGPPEIVAEIIYGASYWARVLKSGSAKLLVARFGDREATELYDLASDPRELHDRAAEDPAVTEALRRRLEELVGSPAEAAAADSTAEFDAATIERLRALGYVR